MTEWNWKSTTEVKERKSKTERIIEAMTGEREERKKYFFEERYEAKWAVFFEYLGLDFLYNHNGGAYVPQFRIPSLGVQVYTRPGATEESSLNSLSGYGRVSIAFNDVRMPLDYDGGGVKVSTFNDKPKFAKYYLWCQCPSCGKIGIIRHDQTLIPCCDYERDMSDYDDRLGVFYTPYLLAAYNAASRAKLVQAKNGYITDYYY